MDDRQLILETFPDMDAAVNSIQQIRWTGRDISRLSIAVREAKPQGTDAKPAGAGDTIELSTITIPFRGLTPLCLKQAQLRSAGTGSLVLAGPVSEWALNGFMAHKGNGGLTALHRGLTGLGATSNEADACIDAVGRGRVLVIIPPPEHKPRHKARADKVRISDMADYD